ncbi:LPXTG cell wall anchor domain-containing protein [Micromonospora sp. GCM10011542]|uniref:LPXTG cell wall anchor domain-containing protein n=1 Tax=Micromonospora sp. GCM10011542 TaxID=3317337 RepID=UPI0036077ED8
MKRSVRAAILATVVLSALAVAGPAVAGPAATPTSTPTTGATTAAAEATITARAELLPLGGDPWHPSAPLEVDVRNQGATAAKGFFVLRLPQNVGLTSGGDCRPDDGAKRTWLCGGAQLPAGGGRVYRLTVTSSAPEPVFGFNAWGSVAGRDADGVTERPTDFRINWPDRTSLRLRATAGPVVDGVATIRVGVTNTGTFDLGGYALNIATPAGVRVTAPACSDSGRMNGVGCEILRLRALPDGATDGFDVRVAVTGGTKDVRLWLAPVNRYTNKDTSVTLRLTGGGSGAGDATTPPPVNPTAAPTSSTPKAAELPRTGSASTTYVLVGAALLTLGAGLLLLRRRFFRG